MSLICNSGLTGDEYGRCARFEIPSVYLALLRMRDIPSFSRDFRSPPLLTLLRMLSLLDRFIQILYSLTEHAQPDRDFGSAYVLVLFRITEILKVISISLKLLASPEHLYLLLRLPASHGWQVGGAYLIWTKNWGRCSWIALSPYPYY